MAQLGHAQVHWRRSSRCDFGQCVEVAVLDSFVAVRDSKDPDGGQLHFAHDAWAGFVHQVRSGAFDGRS